MPLVPSCVATALYLLPVAVVVVARWSPDRSPRLVATDVPCAVAIDMLTILALAHVMRLDLAIVTSRCAWSVLGAWVIMGRWATVSRFHLPLAIVPAGLLGLLVSAWRSHPYAIWDRQWHIPLVSSLRGQSLPFTNVYQPQIRLGYHVTGDVWGAMIQTLSGASLHSSAAMSLAHDIAFALTAVSLSAFLLGGETPRRWSTGLAVAPRVAGAVAGGRPPWSAREACRSCSRALLFIVAPLAVLLAGPLPIGRFDGFSYLNYFQMSFRPHVVLAGLLTVGIVADVVTRLHEPTEGGITRMASLWPMLGLLAITDEPSAVMLVPALVLVLFLRQPHPGAHRRRLWTALSFPLVVGGAILFFPSTFRGGFPLSIAVTSPHVPSLSAPSRELPSLLGFSTLLADVSPLLGVLIVLATVAARTRRRELGGLLVFGTFIMGIGCSLLTMIVIAGSAGESHRFMTLPMVVMPVIGLWLVQIAEGRARWALIVVLALPAVATIVWAIALTPLFQHFAPDAYAPGIHEIDCRRATGSRIFEPVRPTYVPASAWYVWAGCHPVFAPGESPAVGPLDVGRPLGTELALARMLGSDFQKIGPPVVTCPVGPRWKNRDDICDHAVRHSTCTAQGQEFVGCAHTVESRSPGPGSAVPRLPKDSRPEPGRY
jgi:hypothetical protein